MVYCAWMDLICELKVERVGLVGARDFFQVMPQTDQTDHIKGVSDKKRQNGR